LGSGRGLVRKEARRIRTAIGQFRLRRHRRLRCPICLWPITAYGVHCTVAYVPGGGSTATETVLIHQRCFPTWLAGRFTEQT
jgi:hypothetical protein